MTSTSTMLSGLRWLTLIGLSAAAVAYISSAFAQHNGTAAEKEVTAAVKGIVAAYSGGPASLEKYFSYYADDMSVIYQRGRWSKDSYYKMWSALNASGGGVASAEIEDLQVQVSPLGDAAVTTYEMPVVRRFPGGVVPAGESSNVTYNMTDVWYKVKGKWVVKSLSFSRLVPAPNTSQNHN